MGSIDKPSGRFKPDRAPPHSEAPELDRRDIRDRGHTGNRRNTSNRSETQSSKEMHQLPVCLPCLPSLLSSKDPVIIRHVKACIPRMPNGFARALFHLARRLKSVVKDQPPDSLEWAVRQWHKDAAPIIGDIPYEAIWAEFCQCWERVKQPFDSTLETLLAEVRAGRMPPEAEQFDSQPMKELVGLCAAMQDKAGADPFFLDCRSAGRVLRLSHEAANIMLKLLCTKHIIKIVQAGQPGRATRYQYIGNKKRK